MSRDLRLYLPFLAGGLGLVVTWIVGRWCGWAVARVKVRMPTLPGVPHSAFEFEGDPHAAKLLGRLERTFFFAVLWADHPVAIAAWLAFKVAAKWSAWNHITRMPERIGDGTLFQELDFRHAWGARVVSRFLIGTLYNVIAAIVGWTVGRSLVMMLYEKP